MSASDNTHPLILADYYSEENWNKFINYLPDYQRERAPSYHDAAKSLDEQEAEIQRQGFPTVRMKVNADDWMSWVVANNKLMTRDTAIEFAMQQYVDDLNRSKN
jgi:hypothetical protein